MDVVYAKATTHISTDMGHTILVIMGTHWRADDPIVKAYPDAFSPDSSIGMQVSHPDAVRQPVSSVEAMTRGPGEKRELPKR